MFFADKEAVQRNARELDERRREQTRLQILDLLEQYGIELPPDAKAELANGARSKLGG